MGEKIRFSHFRVDQPFQDPKNKVMKRLYMSNFGLILFSLSDIRYMHLIIEPLALMYCQALLGTEVRLAAGFNCRTVGRFDGG